MLFSPSSALPSAPVEIEPAIIPQPRQISVEQRSPGFLLQGGIRVDSATSHSELGRTAIRALTAAGFTVLPEEMQGELTVELSSLPHPEAYSLEVTPSGICIRVAQAEALSAAAQTLAQAVCTDAAGQAALPAMRVEDAPWLGHRGIMLKRDSELLHPPLRPGAAQTGPGHGRLG